MLEMFSGLILLHPWYLFLVPIYYLIKYFVSKKLKPEIFSNFKLLDSVASSGFSYSKVLEFLVVLFIVIALATPAKVEQKQLQNKEGYSIALLLDASSSMQEQGRFKLAKSVVKDFLKKRVADEVGLVFFANYAYIASPLTYDKASLLKMLDFIKLGVAGSRETALYEALYQGGALFKSSNTKRKIVILLSDGINSVNSISRDEALDMVKKMGLKVYTIGLGSSGDVDVDFLKRVAKVSGGEFYLSARAKDLRDIYNKIDSMQKSKIRTKSVTKYSYYYKPLLYLALFLVTLLWISYSFNRVFLALLALLLIAIFLPLGSKSVESKDIKNITFNVALDLSYYMQADDIYPSRLEFAKAKLKELFSNLKGQKVALFGFADSAYLISPPTNDYKRLIFALEHLDLSAIKRDKVSILKLLEAQKLLSNSKNLLILTSGGDNSSFIKEINYLKDSSINLVIYAVGTSNGGVVSIGSGYLKNSSGDIKVVKLNSNLEALANTSSNKYIKATLDSNLVDIVDSFSKSKESIKGFNSEPKIYLYLILFLILLVVATTKRGKI